MMIDLYTIIKDYNNAFYSWLRRLIYLYFNYYLFYMENQSYPVRFKIETKRGGSYQERIIELYRDEMKYFDPSKYNEKYIII